MLSRENNKGTDETYIFGKLNLLNSSKICYWGEKSEKHYAKSEPGNI